MTTAAAQGDSADRSFPCEILEQHISVPFDYPVCFTRNLFHPRNDLLESVITRRREKQRHRALVWVDEGVAAARPDLVPAISAYFENRRGCAELVSEPLTIAGGERVKVGWEMVREIIGRIASHHLCRHGYVVAVGGGGVLDAVGLAAALVHRGLRLIRVPTTVTAQNDVGVGVKNGIDEFDAKNFIGTFAPPFAVLNDFDFLRTLDMREWLGGIAEAFKVATIRDAAFFDFLCGNAVKLKSRNEKAMERLIVRCATLHLEHIRDSGDPFEFGSARPLDFGHWAAHKIEVMSGYGVTHGYAVAVGIALDSVYAMKQRLISPSELDRILSGLRSCGLPVWHPLLERRRPDGRLEMLSGLEDFRQHLGGELTVTLPAGIGRRMETHEMDAGVIEEALKVLKAAEEKSSG